MQLLKHPESEFLSDCTPNSPDQSNTGPAINGEHQPESGDLQSTNQATDEGTQVIKEVEEEKNLTSTPEKAPCSLPPLQLSQLRTKNTDSFDMEEVRHSPPFSSLQL